MRQSEWKADQNAKAYPSIALLLLSAGMRHGLIHLAHHLKSCSVQYRLKLYETVCKRFLHVSFEGSSIPCRSSSDRHSTTPLTAGVTLHRHQYCTSSQRSCLGFNFTLVYLSVGLVPFSFNHVSASLRPSIMVFITLPSALAWYIEWNLAGQGLLPSLFFLSASCSVCVPIFHPTPLFWLLHFEPSRSVFLPLLLSQFPLPQLFQGSQKRGASLCLLHARPACLIAGFSPASNSAGVELLSVLELLTVSQLKKACANL